jgi:hypothetical protein
VQRMASIPVNVREVMGDILEQARKRNTPFAVSEAVDQVRRRFPDLEISDNGLIEALASEAVSANVDMDLVVSEANRTALSDRDGESERGQPMSNSERHVKRRRPVAEENAPPARTLEGEAGIIDNNNM